MKRDQMGTRTAHPSPQELLLSNATRFKCLHAKWWQMRIDRQKEIDASIAAKAEFEYLYDKPYIDKDRVRVAGPFTVESMSPHRALAVGEDDELINQSTRSWLGQAQREYVFARRSALAPFQG